MSGMIGERVVFNSVPSSDDSLEWSYSTEMDEGLHLPLDTSCGTPGGTPMATKPKRIRPTLLRQGAVAGEQLQEPEHTKIGSSSDAWKARKSDA